MKLWLGIPLFNCHSNPVRCPCGQVIDPYGDHLLGCGHDGNRTRRHDALRDVVWHALQVNNKEAKIEQHCCGDSRSQPDDIYHTDYLNGTPTFFDITVRNSLQGRFLNQASVKPGAAATAGEEEKV